MRIFVAHYPNSSPAKQPLADLSIQDLKQILAAYGVVSDDCDHKSDCIARIKTVFDSEFFDPHAVCVQFGLKKHHLEHAQRLFDQHKESDGTISIDGFRRIWVSHLPTSFPILSHSQSKANEIANLFVKSITNLIVHFTPTINQNRRCHLEFPRTKLIHTFEDSTSMGLDAFDLNDS
jgi:hypothetical protein